MSAITGPFWEFSGLAAADQSATQYRFLKPDTTAGQYATAGAGETTVGIQKEKPNAAAKPLSVVFTGRYKLEVDGSGTSIAAGDYLKSDANGKGVKTTTDTDEYGAIALEASTADGDIISVLVTQGYIAG